MCDYAFLYFKYEYAAFPCCSDHCTQKSRSRQSLGHDWEKSVMKQDVTQWKDFGYVRTKGK